MGVLHLFVAGGLFVVLLTQVKAGDSAAQIAVTLLVLVLNLAAAAREKQ